VTGPRAASLCISSPGRSKIILMTPSQKVTCGRLFVMVSKSTKSVDIRLVDSCFGPVVPYVFVGTMLSENESCDTDSCLRSKDDSMCFDISQDLDNTVTERCIAIGQALSDRQVWVRQYQADLWQAWPEERQREFLEHFPRLQLRDFGHLVN